MRRRVALFGAASVEQRKASPIFDVRAETDDALALRAGAGDRAAAAILVDRHSGHIFALCRRMLGSDHAAEDATQETFLRLWRHVGRWRQRDAKFGTWLYKIASNVCIDTLRKSKRVA
ncbi:MAG: sigma-70 family RNA polymerase sigma factor, partial [Pseudomonadota bacterium]